MPRPKRPSRSHAYRWATSLRTHSRPEFDRVLRLGTPSEWLVEADRVGGLWGGVRFPLSLATAKGQRLLYEVLGQVDAYFEAIPVRAWRLRQRLPDLAGGRRTAEARRHAVWVAEAVLHRMAVERSPTVLCAWWTIAEWIAQVHHRAVSLHTVGAALRFWCDLGEAAPYVVHEWGAARGRQEPTRLSMRYGDSERSPAPSPTPYPIYIGGAGSGIDEGERSQAAEWVAEHAHAVESIILLEAEKGMASRQRRAAWGRARNARPAHRTGDTTMDASALPIMCPAGHTGDDLMLMLTPAGEWWPGCVRCLMLAAPSDAATWTAEDAPRPPVRPTVRAVELQTAPGGTHDHPPPAEGL